MTDDLPEGWRIASLADCVDILDNRRVPINSSERAKRPGPVPYYGATGRVGWIDDFIFDEELVLIGEDGAPFLDKSRPIAYLIHGKSWVNNHAHVLRARPGATSNQFIKYYLDSIDFAEHVNGTTRLKLTKGSLARIPVTLPPLPHQKRIVKTIDALLGKASAARERLTRVREILKRFRQSVLAAACSGRLLRDDNGALAMPESALAEVQEEHDTRQGLPSGWQWVRFGDLLAGLRSGTTQPPQDRPTSMPVLRSSSVRPGVVDLADVRYFDTPAPAATGYCVRDGDLLITRLSGSLDFVANCAQVSGVAGQTVFYPDRLFRARLFDQRLGPYVVLCFASPVLRQSLRIASKSTAGHQRISMAAIADFAIPLPRPEMRDTIVRRAESLLALANEVEQRVEAANAKTERLAQAVLSRAFLGDIVAFDAELGRTAAR